MFGYELIQATETSSVFIAVMLTLHPEHQVKVFQEISTIVSNKDADFTQSNLDKLKLRERCVREILRLKDSLSNRPIKARNAMGLN